MSTELRDGENTDIGDKAVGLSQSDLNAMFDLLPRLVMLIDMDGTIIYWSGGGEQLFGYTPQETVGRPVWFLYPERTGEQFQDDLKTLKRGDTITFEVQGRDYKGNSRWFDVKRLLFTLEDDRQVILGTASDISKQKMAEQELKDSRSRIQAILNTCAEGIITINQRGVIQSFNRSSEEIFGYTAREIIGENVKILMPQPYSEKHDEYLKNYHATGESRIIGSRREVRGRRKDGTTFPMEISVSEMEFNDEKFYTGIVKDISERRELEKKIVQAAERERRRIGQDLHDDLGQMLTGIGLISQNLARKLKANGLEGAEEVRQIAEMIKEADQKARMLSRGLSLVDFDVEELGEVLSSLCERVEMLFGIRCELISNKDTRMEDRDITLNLYRIAQEAISNSVKHGKASTVEVHLHNNKDHLQLTIADDGTGFTQPVPEAEENGVGLKGMHYRVQLLGGQMDIHRGEEDRTLITCTIPLPESSNGTGS